MAESKNGVVARCIDIGPEEAKHILQYNSKNRDRCATTEERYSEDMLRGRFVTSAAGIGITVEGILADGQSRLNAIIRSGKTVSLLVVTGLPKESHGVHDRQRKRLLYYSLAESNQIPKSDKLGVQVAYWLAFHEYGHAHAPSDSQVADTYNKHMAGINAIGACLSKRDKGICRAGVRAAMVMAYEKYQSEAVEFMALIQKENHAESDHPAFRLRKYLMAHNRGSGYNSQLIDFQSTVYAFNAFKAGAKVNGIRQSNDIK